MVDVIVPVYGGKAQLERCLRSLVTNPQRTGYRLILINDASPDPDIPPRLRQFAHEHPQVELLENEQNLGFVATVNRGMALHSQRDVVLLNSDTEVANDWLDRLVRAAYRDERVGTVTPFSNNATICSFPRFCVSNPLPQGWDLKTLDQLFSQVNAGEVVEIPTGVGFCQYIRRQCLDEVGLFDAERFGRGYGEENDFCRRAAKLGWRNLLCCDTFVFHEGGVSFSQEQAERVARAQEILDRLHPDYHGLVRQHIQEDPAARYRFWVQAEMLRRSPRRKVLHLTHHLGGGTKKHIAELADYLQDRMDALVIRPVESGGIRLFFGGGEEAPALFFALPSMYPDLLELLGHVGVSRIHFHHTLGLDTLLWGLPDDLHLPFDITLHDYYFVNAHPSQTDARGRYTPDLEAQSSSYPLSMRIDEWQANQRQLLEKAERVIAPSAWTVLEFSRHYPGLNYLVAFHPDSEQQMPWPPVCSAPAAGRPLRILALGALSPEKGPDVLEKVAMAAARAGSLLEFHLLGYAYRPLDGTVIEHGSYTEEELAKKLVQIAPDLVWFTALWPETYSYTLSEILAAGLPAVVPDIGAFPERVRGRPLTWVVPWNQEPAAWLEWFERLRAEMLTAGEQFLEWSDQPSGENPGFYEKRYLGAEPQVVLPAVMDSAGLAELLARSRRLEARGGGVNRREWLLQRLLVVRKGRVGRLLSRLLPVSVQRKLKRKLSRKPLHEIDRR